jgi:predicted MPP superfamily phosphohydrolase
VIAIEMSPLGNTFTAMNRREFLRLAGKGALASLAAGGIYGAIEAKRLQVTRFSIRVPNLPALFDNFTIALLADFHHSAVVPLSFIEHSVSLTNSLAPDAVVLVGDYVTAGKKYHLPGCGPSYIAPCFDALKNFKAKHGVFAVTGNHDEFAGIEKIDTAIADAGFENLTNRGVWLTKNGERVRFCGVGEFCTQRHTLPPAIGDATQHDAVIVATHNPDFVENFHDPRVSLMLSGHTHGGQIVLPFIGAPMVPSQFRQKYRYGLLQGPTTQIFVTSGVGTLPLAVRIHCPPEIALLTLTA